MADHCPKIQVLAKDKNFARRCGEIAAEFSMVYIFMRYFVYPPINV